MGWDKNHLLQQMRKMELSQLNLGQVENEGEESEESLSLVLALSAFSSFPI